jgi:catechol 2,3-dioxygenase-like lactoylglutathione lyase family enzyme
MLTGLDHIQMAIPAGGEDLARSFYIGVLRLSEVAKPDALTGRGGLWLTGPGITLHLGTQTPFTPATKAHPAFQVASLTATKAQLDRTGTAFTPDTDLPGITRVFVTDPFGNRIELLERV